MKTIFATLVLFFGVGLASDNLNLKEENNTINIENTSVSEPLIITDDLYEIKLTIEETENQLYTLVVSIELRDNAHFISPYAKGDFSGKFYMDLGETIQLDFYGKIQETPPSVEEYDPHPFVEQDVNWVRVNTVYKQPLLLLAQKDFQVMGRIQFTIEPRCTFEEIPFRIIYNSVSGEMRIADAEC